MGEGILKTGLSPHLGAVTWAASQALIVPLGCLMAAFRTDNDQERMQIQILICRSQAPWAMDFCPQAPLAQRAGLLQKTNSSTMFQVKKSGERLGEGLGDSLHSRLPRLIRAKSMVSIAEMSQHISISTTAVEKTLKRLKTKGMLQRIGSARSGHWEVSGC